MLDMFKKMFGNKLEIDVKPSHDTKVLNSVQKAELAKQILENPLWNEAIKKVEEELIAKWKNSSIKDKELRELIFYRVEALQNINDTLRGFLNSALYELQDKLQAKQYKEEL